MSWAKGILETVVFLSLASTSWASQLFDASRAVNLRATLARLNRMQNDSSIMINADGGSSENNGATFRSYFEIGSNETIAEQSHRFLHSRESPYFQPLDCGVPDCSVNTTWTKQRYDGSDGTVVIPCGHCVWMDHDQDETLVLPHGIDVQGHLYFPDGYSLTIETPFVLVQGLLEMNSTGQVTDEPLIKFVIAATRQNVGFFPAYNNKFVCPTSTGRAGKCDMGFRSVVVAGGTFRARGLPTGCTTWTYLDDVVPVSGASIPNHITLTRLPELDSDHPNRLCRSYDPYIDESFETDVGKWTGGYGALFRNANGAFVTTNRKSAQEHGPTFDLVSFQECMVPGQKYLFSARVRIDDPLEARGEPTPCNAAGCLGLVFSTRFANGTIVSHSQQQPYANTEYRNSVWDNFYATVELTEDELSSQNTFHILQLVGAEERYDIFLDDVSFGLPDPSLVPDPNDICGSNMVMNGDAEGHSIHPYPMEAIGNGQLTIRTFPATGNRVFLVSQRSRDTDSLVYLMDAPNCITTLTRYRISAQVYAESPSVSVEIVIKYSITLLSGETRTETAAECPSSQEEWMDCSSTFSIPNDIKYERIQSIQFWFETRNAPTVDFMVDDFSLFVDKAAKSGILVPRSGVRNCWNEGAEILITSHTSNTADSQVRRMVHNPISVGNGLVRLELDDDITMPVTAQQDARFPVEVALLSRNIRFQAREDARFPLLGGHFIVLRTPLVDQHIEGIEFINFGQQGNLGRYPIHLHLCKNANSLITKNTVRESNQRCIVIHGSHNTTIEENIAFNTSGHCFLTEDGGELDNRFIRNLGSNTRRASLIVREGESDANNPSTFWSANPKNEWIGNVAAGSDANGFWLELLDSVKMPTAMMETSFDMNPRRLPLTSFVDNVAHSNFRHGLKMYPHGLLPSETAVFENFKSYKNRRDGFFFRNMENAVVQGGILADNRYQADFDFSDTMLMRGTQVIGITPRFKEIMEEKGGSAYHQDRVVGLELHSFARDPSKKGLTIRNIVFDGFDGTNTTHTALVEIDGDSDDPWTGNFNYWTTFEGVKIRNSDVDFYFDFLEAMEKSYKGVYLVDVDSSMRPPSSDATGISTIIADSDEITTFVDPELCTRVRNRGYQYCRDTCLQSYTYGVDPGQVENLRLRVRTIPAKNDFFVEGSQDVLVNENMDRHIRAKTDLAYLRYFTVAVPPGDYRAMFVHNITDERFWPTFVEKWIEPSFCGGSVDDYDVKLNEPGVEAGDCVQLIRNGDIEQSAVSAPYWLHHNTLLEVANRQGRRGSRALTEIDQKSPVAYVGQYVDVRCLNKGDTYFIQVWVYMELDGFPGSCDETRSDDCPRLEVGGVMGPGERGVTSFADFSFTVSRAFAKPLNDDGWNLLQGLITVGQDLAAATRAVVYVERRRAGVKLFLDDVSMTHVNKECSELVFNGDFSDGSTSFWDRDEGTLDVVVSNRNHALQHSGRINAVSSITQRIQTGCMKEGERFVVTAKTKVLSPDGGPFHCNPSRVFGDMACPRLRIRTESMVAANNSVSSSGGYIAARTDHGVTSDNWMTISGVFSATKTDELAEQNVLDIDGPPEGVIVIVDDVSISPLPLNCDELILNGDAEWGGTARFWRISSQREAPEIKVISENSGNRAFRLTERETSNDGIAQSIDDRCMELGSKWKVEAEMKLRSRSDGSFGACKPGRQTGADNACPSVHLFALKDGVRVDEHRTMTNKQMTWVKNAFNKYESIVEVTQELQNGHDFHIGFQSFDVDWDLILDNVSVTPF